MLLRAQPISRQPSRRWVIQNIKQNTVWDGDVFVEDWAVGRKYAHPSDACADMAKILKAFYGKLEKRTFVVPIEVEVFGSAKPKEIAQYLYKASILNVQTEEHGNGPAENLILPIIHWGKIREARNSTLLSKPDGLDRSLELEETDEDQ